MLRGSSTHGECVDDVFVRGTRRARYCGEQPGLKMNESDR